jgi:hypothetical protein
MPSDELSVEQWPIERLLPYVANARTHPDEQVAQIAGSIAEFGFNVPCLVDDRGILIAGHGRLIAAKRLGLADVPVIRLAHLTDAQARAFRLADNRIALNAGWDEALLAAELGRLKEDGVDLELLGFGEDELDRLLDGLDGEAAADGENDVPEPPTEAVTKPGDLWLLGAHRLLCGDATVTTHVERLLGGKRPHLMVTDPPYGVEYDPNWRNEAGVSATARTGKVSNDDRADWREAWALFPGDAAYVWHSGVRSRTVIESLETCGFKIRAQIIWAKPRLVLGRGDYALCFAPIEADDVGNLAQQLVMAQQRLARGALKMAMKGLSVGRCAQECVEAFYDRSVRLACLFERLQRDEPIRIDEPQEIEKVLGVRLQRRCGQHHQAGGGIAYGLDEMIVGCLRIACGMGLIDDD